MALKEYPAIIAALPREVKQLVRGWQVHKLPDGVVLYTNEFAVVACAGMGQSRAALAVQAALSVKPVTALLSVGLAGACHPSLRVGDIVNAGLVIDTQTGERFGNIHESPVLVSGGSIASLKEKQRLRASYGAVAVDMEAAEVARIAQSRGLSFQAIKAISDEAAFELKDLARFVTSSGQLRQAALVSYAIVRPQLLTKLFHLAVNSRRAVQSLTVELETQLCGYKNRS